MIWIFAGFLIYLLLVVAERALVAIAPHELEVLRAEGTPSARRAFDLATEYIRPALAALLLGRIWIKVVLVGTTVAAAMQIIVLNPDPRNLWDWSDVLHVPDWVAGVLGTGVAILFFSLAFWAFKSIDFRQNSRIRPASCLKALSIFITFWKLVFSPFIKTPKNVDTAEIASSAKSKKSDNALSNNLLVSEAPVKAPEKRDIELLKSIVKFGDVTVKQVMHPRSKVVAVDAQTNFHAVLDLVHEAGFSRMPVFEEDMDNTIGMLYVKDLVAHIDADDDFKWQNLIRPDLLRVPESKHISELLREFKRSKRHIAVVVDEYGGTAGVVTMEDILEEVTGEIRDEFDEGDEVPPFRRLDASTFEMDGQTMLNDVCRIAGLNPGTFDSIRDTADTLAGLLLELHDDIPPVGAEIVWEDYSFTVTAGDQRRIEQVRLRINDHQ